MVRNYLMHRRYPDNYSVHSESAPIVHRVVAVDVAEGRRVAIG